MTDGPMSNEAALVEQIARAMFTHDGVCSDHDWDNANEIVRVHFRTLAQAAAEVICTAVNAAVAKALDEAAKCAEVWCVENRAWSTPAAATSTAIASAIRNLKGTDNG